MTRGKREPEDLYLHHVLVVSVFVLSGWQNAKKIPAGEYLERTTLTVLGAVCTHRRYMGLQSRPLHVFSDSSEEHSSFVYPGRRPS